MSRSPIEDPPSPRGNWPRVHVHPGSGLVDRRGDTLLVVPELPTSRHEWARDLLELCHRPDPTGDARVRALQDLLDRTPPAEVPGFALLVRTGHSLRAVVHGPVRVLVDGRAPAQPGAGGGRLAEHVVEDGAWQALTVAAGGEAALPGVPGILPFDLEAGSVPGAAVVLHRVPAGRAPQAAAAKAADAVAAGRPTTSSTQLRPAVQFRSVPLGECAARAPGGRPAPEPRPPLPVAGAGGAAAVAAWTAEPGSLVEGVTCPTGHFTDPDASTCLTCGVALPPGRQRVRLARPPLGILVTDGGTIYTVTGDYVIGREVDQAPDVVAGRARPLPLRDTARSTSRVHARLTIRGWKVLLSDNRSANGTFVSRHGATGPWLPVPAEPPLPLLHGDRVRLGKRQLLFDAWREPVVPQVFR